MASFKVVEMILVFITLAYFSITAYSAIVDKVFVPSPGPKTFAFDSFGKGPYTGVTDGRILKYDIPTKAFITYAITAPNRSALVCDGMTTSRLALTCGRPLGIAFYKLTNQLYVADAYLGLFVVEPLGGQGILLANSANGTQFHLTNGLDVDQTTGNVYFTDASSTGGINELTLPLLINDSTGRLLKYNPTTKRVTVLLSGLLWPPGVVVSKDGSYLLFTEYISMRIQKYWLRGPKTNTVEVILNVTGNPDKIRRSKIPGEYWVAVTSTPAAKLLGLRFDGVGNVIETLTFSPEFMSPGISEVHEYGDDELLLGSLNGPYIGVYKR